MPYCSLRAALTLRMNTSLAHTHSINARGGGNSNDTQYHEWQRKPFPGTIQKGYISTQHLSFSNKIDKGLCIIICIIIAHLLRDRQTDRQMDTQLDGWSERGKAQEMKCVGHVRKILK